MVETGSDVVMVNVPKPEGDADPVCLCIKQTFEKYAVAHISSGHNGVSITAMGEAGVMEMGVSNTDTGEIYLQDSVDEYCAVFDGSGMFYIEEFESSPASGFFKLWYILFFFLFLAVSSAVFYHTRSGGATEPLNFDAFFASSEPIKAL